VKPYASDLLAALVLLGLALRWRRAPERSRWLWVIAAASPVAIALSHPALFIAGGVSLSLAAPVWKQRRWGIWIPFLLFQLGVAGTFLGLYALCTRFQEQLALGGLRTYWAASFPPLDSPMRLLRWVVAVHTGTMFAYPGGGRGGSSTPTLLAVVAGSIWLWRRRRRGAVVMLLVPFALALGAAVLRRYPYGVEARQMQFLAPAICLLAGLGAAWLLHVLPGSRVRSGLAALALVVLAGCGLTALAGDLARPYRFPYDHETRGFARRFWPEQARTAELACLCADFGVDNRRSHHLRTALYLCNQWIYSPQRRQHGGPSWELISARRPLRAMLFNETSPEDPQVAQWLATMQRSFDLRRTLSIESAGEGARLGKEGERVVIFEFVPRAGLRLEAPAVAGQGLHMDRLLR
jgi:hypothetical protein